MLAPQVESADASDSAIWDMAARGDTTFQGSALRSRPLADVIRAGGEFSISKYNPSNDQQIHFGGFAILRGKVFPPSDQQISMRFTTYRLQSSAEDILDHLHKYPPNAAMQIAQSSDRILLVRSSAEGHIELTKRLEEIDQSSQP